MKKHSCLTEIGNTNKLSEMIQLFLYLAKRLRKALFRVGVFQSVATQWMPQIVGEFCQEHPDTVLQM